jgi:hypothetical protein
MVSFVEYLAALSVKDVLKLCADRRFISHSVLRKVQDHIAVRIARGENIDAEDRASCDRLQTQVGLRGGTDASVALNTVPTQKSAALDVSTRPLSAVSEPLHDPPSFSAEISDDDLEVLMNIIEQCEADAAVALNVMPAPKSRALEAPARPHADVSDPMLRAAPFSPEVNDADLDMLMNIIDEELGRRKIIVFYSLLMYAVMAGAPPYAFSIKSTSKSKRNSRQLAAPSQSQRRTSANLRIVIHYD